MGMDISLNSIRDVNPPTQGLYLYHDKEKCSGSSNLQAGDHLERIKSGIIGLDELIEGGFEKGTLIEISGSEGTFKTTFALQFAAEGIRNGEKVTYISFEEPYDSIKQTANGIGISEEFEKIEFKNMEINDIISALKSSISFEGSEEMARKMVREVDSSDRLILDTATTLALYSSGTVKKLIDERNFQFVTPSTSDMRIMLFFLANELRKNLNCTTLLLAEAGIGELYIPEEILKYICDGKIALKKSTPGAKNPRSLVIEKMRHTNNSPDEQPMVLTKKGIKIGKAEQ